jgi:hypothetical protein
MNEICNSKYIAPFISSFPEDRRVRIIKKLVKYGLQEMSKHLNPQDINEHTISEYINHKANAKDEANIIEQTVEKIKKQLSILDETIHNKLKTSDKKQNKPKLDANITHSPKRTSPQRLCNIDNQLMEPKSRQTHGEMARNPNQLSKQHLLPHGWPMMIPARIALI